jgi:hypothetical protein
MAKLKAQPSRNPLTGITATEFAEWLIAYDHFNRTLFGGSLGEAFINYQRKAGSGGHFAWKQYVARDDGTFYHEISLNPDGFIGRTDEFIASIFVHEMTHAWQHQHGKPSGRGYHNREFAAKSKAIGLQPSSTGAVGGRETGARMGHYIIPKGPYAQTFAALAATGWQPKLQSAPRGNPTKTPNTKFKFTCPNCGQNAWGVAATEIGCWRCKVFMPRAGRKNASYDQKEDAA